MLIHQANACPKACDVRFVGSLSFSSIVPAKENEVAPVQILVWWKLAELHARVGTMT